MSIEQLLWKQLEAREASARLWLSEIMSREPSLNELEDIFGGLLKNKKDVSQLEEPGYELKLEYLAKKIDYLRNPTGERQMSSEEESTSAFIRDLSEIEQ